jgi:hypothetical protein
LCLPKPMEMDGADGCLKLTAEESNALSVDDVSLDGPVANSSTNSHDSPSMVLLPTVLQIHTIMSVLKLA